MLYDIRLRISYEYTGLAEGGRQLLRLMPADLPGEQRLIAGHLDVQPRPDERIARTDFFGNQTVEAAFSTAHGEIEFRVEARVERFARPSSLDISPSLARLSEEIADYRGLGPRAPHHFLGASPRVAPDGDMSSYARALLREGATVLEAVREVGLALNRDMRFDADVTDVDTPPAEAFARRHGVCQDFTHVMIACLRGIGVPAGYVSGFLRTIPPPGEARLEGADAMHAWVQAWCGIETGWVEYDPTNAQMVGSDHVVVARGRDYSDVSPIRGVLRTAGTQQSWQAVDMMPLDAA